MHEIKFIRKDGTTEIHKTNSVDLSDFDDIISKIHDTNIQSFAKNWLRIAPEYIFTAPASSSGKYHPAIDLGKGGLKRHLINTANMVIYLTEPECQREKFTEHEIDIMICAAILHDILKSGWQEDYEQNKNTRFDHPRILAEIMTCDNDMDETISKEDIMAIASCIETHMGEWTTDKHQKEKPLKKPSTEMQKMVHMADYLVSRRNLSFIQNETVFVLDSQNIVTIKQFNPVSSKDLAIIHETMLMDELDMNLANEMGIMRQDTDIKCIWGTILKTKSASARQMKYVNFAKTMYERKNNNK